LEQQTEQLKHQTQALEAHTRTIERRLRWWRGKACGMVIPALFSLALPSGKAADTPAQTLPRQTLLLKSKRVQKRSCIRRLKARETGAILLEKLTSMALETDRCALTNRVTTSFTSMGNEADFIQGREPLAALTV
jgi:hypothetical protein